MQFWSGRRGRLRAATVAAVIAAVILVSSVVSAQRGGRFGGGRYRQARYSSLDEVDSGTFQFCRIVFSTIPGGDGGDWSVDWPRADENLSIRLSELTKTPISKDEVGDPRPLLINLRQPILFHCPFIMMTEVGNIFLDDLEVKNLREYLLKGGFLWADDFWGEYAWSIWESQIRKVLPSGQYPFVDLPLTHSIFHTVFTVHKFPQIPSIGAWGGPGGNTSERGQDSAVPHARALLDDHQRVMVLITHNTDFGDSFEREGDNHEYFIEMSVPGYAFGINALIYSMTH